MNVTELAFKDLMEEDTEKNENELLELLEFYRYNGVPLTEQQVKATMILNEYGLKDIALFANEVRPLMTKPKMFMKLIEKITLADRIKGNAKLSNLLKANVASTSQQMPNASEYQAKALRKSELR
jgi:hypothetical protein